MNLYINVDTFHEYRDELTLCQAKITEKHETKTFVPTEETHAERAPVLEGRIWIDETVGHSFLRRSCVDIAEGLESVKCRICIKAQRLIVARC
ncbi:MAG TPA: hypothetical protein VFE61_21075 [Candidatus Sulfotelmatobacter sp.]|nr:hypothetical protein [Candidatus Sulfotelmatobacter sp.]